MREALARQPDPGRKTPSAVRRVWTFTRHFLGMCVAMCVGRSALIALVFLDGPALGHPDPRDTAPYEPVPLTRGEEENR